MKTQPENRLGVLEGWLRKWVDVTWINFLIASNRFIQPEEERASYPPPTSIEKNCRAYIDYLKKARPNDSFDAERFWETPPKGEEEETLVMNTVPHALWSWKSQSGGRVFRLSSDLQVLLLSASYESALGFEDLDLPFDSFAIELARPLIMESGVQAHCMLFSKLPREISGLKTDYYCLHILDDGFDTYHPIPHITQERILAAVRSGSLEKVQKILIPLYQRLHDKREHFVLFTAEGLKSLLQTSEEMKAKRAITGQAFSLLAGLVLYLSSLPPTSPHRSTWSLKNNKGNKPVIATAHICEVTTESWITPAQADELHNNNYVPRKGWQAPPHFRRAHTRRKAGEGDNPNAPRIVRVRATFVHGELLPSESPLPGSRSKVK